MGEVTVLVEGPAGAEALEVAWRGDIVIGEEVRGIIDARWEEYLADAAREGRTLFNGPVTWAMGVRGERDGSGKGRIVLTLGGTDYKTFVVTVQRDRVWFERHAPESMRPALGNSVLLTHGERGLLGVRSEKTSAYADRAHLIGGVLDLPGGTASRASAAAIVAHLRREMREEAGIQEEELCGSPILLMVARDEFLGQPELVWRWEVAIDLDIVGQRLDAEEHKGWVGVEKRGIGPVVWERMTPLARAAWERWRGGSNAR